MYCKWVRSRQGRALWQKGVGGGLNSLSPARKRHWCLRSARTTVHRTSRILMLVDSDFSKRVKLLKRNSAEIITAPKEAPWRLECSLQRQQSHRNVIESSRPRAPCRKC